MKAFEFDHHLISSYERFSRSFSSIRSDDLRAEIDAQYDAGRFWPDALLSLNPRFLSGPTVDDLVKSRDLDEGTGQVLGLEKPRFAFTAIKLKRLRRLRLARALW